ncbi:hypothetical protein [Leekyejoonella antrihumi]|uniref:DUF3159 domain-containing protein n=1 Tax=Leekyejoonella antrihumi TaxID=1660198 RepID=A0A563E5Z9_9MICO|nr:hypothetical protein [Leekyejoonella antrihumi]TWP37673.1 hypothetical protein FGL98_05580 [Leekyejoonella antrihumi]
MQRTERTGPDPARLVIDRAFVRDSAVRGGRLLVETVMVPSLLLYGGIMTLGKIWGLAAVLCWCAFTVGLRLHHSARVPRTLLLAVGMLVGRTTIALALSSVYVFLLQPIAGSLFMAVLFLGSAAIGRPITMHLARDFIALPQALFHDRLARRMFTQVCVLWGVSRLIDAAMSVGFLRLGLGAGLLSRGLLSSTLTVASIAVCTAWGWSRIRRMPNFTIATS